MIIKHEEKQKSFKSPGDRLEHLLSQIGFQTDRGIITDLHTYLTTSDPIHFSNLSYGTVRGWFADNAPPMKRIDLIIDALQKQYAFDFDLVHIKTWWKVGGFYPFIETVPKEELAKLDSEARLKREKTAFVIMALVTEESGVAFDSLSADELKSISDVANQFVKDFTDPYQTSCPNHYLRAIIRDQLKKV